MPSYRLRALDEGLRVPTQANAAIPATAVTTISAFRADAPNAGMSAPPTYGPTPVLPIIAPLAAAAHLPLVSNVAAIANW